MVDEGAKRKKSKMTPMDLLWIGWWFVVGLFVFQMRGIKRIMEDISGLNFGFSIVILVLGTLYGFYTLPNVLFCFVGSVIIGFLSIFSYLIGANISRWRQFGNMSFNIYIYGLLFILLLLFYEILLL